MKKLVFFIAILFVSNVLFGQMVVVKGRVTGFHEFPVKNIIVKCKKSDSTALTDDNGVFEIACMPNETLILESRSFRTERVKVKSPEDSVKINLVFKDTPQSREYAVAYGIMSEETLTYAIANYTNENNDYERYQNIYDLIASEFPGVTVNGNNILIRGITSFAGSNNALLVVDGIVVSDISGFSPRDIKSVDILKDAATSMYGSQGANGVVLIQTKRE